MARYAKTLVELSTTFGAEIAKHANGLALSPQRLGSIAGTAQSRQELDDLNRLLAQCQQAYIAHRRAAEREHEALCRDVAPAAAVELSNYFNARVELDLQFEIALLDCLRDFCASAGAICHLIDERRDFIEVTPAMVCFVEDDDLECYQRLMQAVLDAVAKQKYIDTNRKAILAANMERLSR